MSQPRKVTAEALWRLPRVGSPLPLPDGSAVIVPVSRYDMDADLGQTRLWRVPADGKGGARPLSSADSSASGATVSPDGRWLAFLRKPGGAAASAAANSSARPGSGPDALPDAHPDTDPDTGPEARSDSKAGAKSEPADLSAFLAGPADAPARPARFPDQAQLYRMPLDGGEAERLTDLPLGAGSPRFLSDGRLLLTAGLLSEAPTLAGARERSEPDSHARALAAPPGSRGAGHVAALQPGWRAHRLWHPARDRLLRRSGAAGGIRSTQRPTPGPDRWLGQLGRCLVLR